MILKRIISPLSGQDEGMRAAEEREGEAGPPRSAASEVAEGGVVGG